MNTQKRLLITLVRSTIGNRADQKATVRALGLTRRMQTVNRADSPSIRGMIHAVRHLVHVTEIEQPAPRRRATRASRPAQPTQPAQPPTSPVPAAPDVAAGTGLEGAVQ